ncbi:hypothetical protein D9758_005392 [Tetrapyrgos nigripes]|uniref:Uncharacterized protein n=1 Tax=Tetrapyrgos nigripes TaxID=182062 RepID=A0A8H5LPK6_9AGAR|nr:hypothetical protein D9758_005392 [Tetrapyrgos nigripes]
MPALASFIDRVRTGRKTKNTQRSPQPDLHPYASPDVVYIGDQSYDAPEDTRATISFDSTAKASATTASSASTPKVSFDSTRTSLTPTRSRSPLSNGADSRSPSPSPSPSPPPSPRRVTPPRMKLSIDFSQDPLVGWIPSHLLDTGVYGASGRNPDAASTSNMSGITGVTGVSADGRSGHFNGLRSDTSSRLSRDTTGVVVDVQTVNEDASLYEDDEDVGGPLNDEDSTEVIVAKLKGMDASAFLNAPQSHLQGFQHPKKVPPSPIKIPRTSPKIQIVRSSVQSNSDIKPDYPLSSYLQSQPPQSNQHQSSYDSYEPYSYDSAGNSASTSAVSGTTLARALIGNTFVLSSDEHASRYRSGGSALTRSDSATLPRGEREYWNYSSPASASTQGHLSYGIFYPGENRRSMTSNSASPMDHEPMPANADAVYSPPQNPRRGGAGEASGSRKRLSTGSIGDEHQRPSEEGISRSKSATATAGPSTGHRISTISESSSASPNISSVTVNDAGTSHTPPRALVPNPSSSIQNSSLAFQNGTQRLSSAPPLPPLPPVPPIPPSSGRSSPNRSSYAASTSGGGPSTGRSSDFGGYLDYYSRSPDLTTGDGFDPYSETQSEREQEQSEVGAFGSSSSSTIASGSGTPGQGVTVNTVGAVGVSVAAIPPASQYRPVFSPIFEESTLGSGLTTPASALSTPSSGGPFSGGRSPSGRRSQVVGKRDSRMAGTSKLRFIGEDQPTSATSSASVRISEFPLPPPPISTVFNRQRSGSAPAPIRVVRDSRDPKQYNILVAESSPSDSSQKADGSQPRTAGSGSTDEGEYSTYPPNPYGLPESRGQQTFPETPNMFSPMWSAAIPGTGPGKRPRHSMDPVLLGLPPPPQTPWVLGRKMALLQQVEAQGCQVLQNEHHLSIFPKPLYLIPLRLQLVSLILMEGTV